MAGWTQHHDIFEHVETWLETFLKLHRNEMMRFDEVHLRLAGVAATAATYLTLSADFVRGQIDLAASSELGRGYENGAITSRIYRRPAHNGLVGGLRLTGAAIEIRFALHSYPIVLFWRQMDPVCC
jgi:hypothetical protein